MPHPPEALFSEYVDGTLEPGQVTLVEVHLAHCAECRALTQDLRRVLQRAQALEDRAPRQDLWPGVAAAIGAAPRQPRRVSFSLPQLLAASLVLTLLSGGAALWLARPALPGTASAPVAVHPSPDAVRPAGEHAPLGYAGAVQELERALAQRGSTLDTATVRVIAQKLAIIDRAIAEAEQALAADSTDPYLHSHLAQTRLRKLELLRHAAALTRAVS